jgi:DNA (cytosine-5)-methyltransferase 1
MRRVIETVRPTWVIGENVAGFVSMELDRSLADLEALGYACQTFVIPACAVDAKHRRDRVWIVGTNANGERPLQRKLLRSLSTEALGDLDREAPILGGEARTVETMADTIGRGQQGQGKPIHAVNSEKASHRQAIEPVNGRGFAEWQPESPVGRVAHGISRRVDRLRGLGNAVVPQVVAEIGRAIRLTEEARK